MRKAALIEKELLKQEQVLETMDMERDLMINSETYRSDHDSFEDEWLKQQAICTDLILLLEEIWKDDPDAVSPDYAELFKEWALIDADMEVFAHTA